MPFLPPNQQRQSTEGINHRHRIHKYLDNILANQTARKVKPTTTDKRVSLIRRNQSQRSSFAVIGYAEAGRRRSPMSVVCCNVEYINFGMHNLCPSNVKVIFQRPSWGYPCSGGFRFHCRSSEQSMVIAKVLR